MDTTTTSIGYQMSHITTSAYWPTCNKCVCTMQLDCIDTALFGHLISCAFGAADPSPQVVLHSLVIMACMSVCVLSEPEAIQMMNFISKNARNWCQHGAVRQRRVTCWRTQTVEDAKGESLWCGLRPQSCCYCTHPHACCSPFAYTNGCDLIHVHFAAAVNAHVASTVTAHVASAVTAHAAVAPHWRLCSFENSFLISLSVI